MAFKEYKTLKANVEEAREILATEKDEEMRKMAQEELDTAQTRIEQLEQDIRVMMIPKDPQAHFEFPSPERLQNALVTIENGVAGYDDKPVLTNLNLRIEPDDRIALLGANGNGKSTLAKILSHRLQLMSGKMTLAKKMKIAYFSQHQTEELDVEKTPYEMLSAQMPTATETQIRAQLGAFGLNKDKSDTEIGKLSGGEKSRLLLALITKDAPHLLILDEPTNHLDLQSRQALLEALNEYEGAVVLITHDLHVIELTCDTLWIVRGATCKTFVGDLEDYRAQLLKNNDRNDLASDKLTSKEAQRKEAAQRRARVAPLKKEIRALDEKIEKMTARKTSLEQQLVSQFSADVSIELALLTSQLKDAEDEWIALNEACEQAQLN